MVCLSDHREQKGGEGSVELAEMITSQSPKE